MSVIEVSADGTRFTGPSFVVDRNADGSFEIHRGGTDTMDMLVVEANEVGEFQMLAKLLGLAR